MVDHVDAHPQRLVVQVVLFENPVSSVLRSMEALSAALAQVGDSRASTRVAIGDCSPVPILGKTEVDSLREVMPDVPISYEAFAANLGHGGAHNWLATANPADFILIVKPDVVVAATTIIRLLDLLEAHETIGIVDGKQLPLEHPKTFDRETGATSWCSGSLCLIRATAFHAVNGFDSSAFFLLGDDVDLSWRIREAGWQACHHPGALGFQDRRVGPTAAIVPNSTERHHVAESALMLAHLWGDKARVSELLDEYESGSDESQKSAADSFRRKLLSGTLREPAAHRAAVASFDGSNYGGHRW